MSSVAKQCKPYVRQTTHRDCYDLSRTMRAADREEIYHSSQVSPLLALLNGYRHSHCCWTVVWQERVVAIFGVVGEGEVGSPWMLASDDLQSIRKSFLRECRDYLGLMFEKHSVLTNQVWAKNEVHIQWIKWLGFQFQEPHDHRGEPFIRFYKVKHV